MKRPRAYYNEVDPYAAQFLRNLIDAGHLPAGDVDERDIRDVKPSNLDGYTQCHFFAGVGIWPLALRTAGWCDAMPIWTGSCPCQPFSAAGAGAGVDDERHLWPDWFWLIQQCRPEKVFGEQVASADGLSWADLVQADLEAADYAAGFVDTCAAGFGGYHIRPRLYFAAEDLRSALRVGNTHGYRAERIGIDHGQAFGVPQVKRSEQRSIVPKRDGEDGILDNTSGVGRDTGWNRDNACHDGQQSDAAGTNGRMAQPQSIGRNQWTGLRATGARCGWAGCADGGGADGLADAHGRNTGAKRQQRGGQQRQQPKDGCGSGTSGQASAPDIDRQAADWLFCRDGKWRPVEPGTFPLVDAHPGRVGELRAYGNGLDLGQATAFVRSYMERHLVDLSAAPAGDLFEWGAA